MLRCLLVILYCFCSSFLFSQIPGYQGKRFFVEGGVSFWFNSANPRANNEGPNTFPGEAITKFTLQEHYFGNLNYVLSRRTIVSLEYEYSKTGLFIREWEGSSFNADEGAKTPSRLINGLFDTHNLFYNLTAHKINFSFSHHVRSRVNIAPLGFYAKWGFDLVLAHSVLMDQKVFYGHDENFNGNRPSAEYTNPLGIRPDELAIMIGGHGGVGYRTVIADRITLFGEARLTLFPQIMARQSGSLAERNGRYDERNQINYLVRVYQRVQMHYYLNLVVGVGVLIF